MKNITLSLVLGFTLALGAGCKTSQINTSIKSEGVIIVTVDTGMKIWAQRVNAGQATQAQVDTVKIAYNAYYSAQQAAKAAIEKAMVSSSTNSTSLTDIATANTAVVNAENSLLSILNTFIK